MPDIEAIISQMDRTNLALDENETTFNQTADNRNVWRVWTNDPVWIRRLAKRGAHLVKWDVWGVGFDLDDGQVVIRNPLSEEERQRLSEQARSNFGLEPSASSDA
jgi:hypothetical protein